MLGLISFIGLLIGILLARISPEEMKPGKKYFILLKKIILIAIIVSIFYYSNISLFGVFIGAFIGYFKTSSSLPTTSIFLLKLLSAIYLGV